MSYNSNLQSKNNVLQSILNTINELPEASNGTYTSDATATADKIFLNETAYGAEGKITGTFTIDEELTEQSDLIEQIKNILSNKEDDFTHILQEKTVIPSTNTQVVIADSEYDALHKVIVQGDSNLKPDNIKSGVSIFGIDGTASTGGGYENGYFYVNNNSPSLFIIINGVLCEPEVNTVIPYSDMAMYQIICVPSSDSQLLNYQYIESYEGDDGEMVEEEFSGIIDLVLDEVSGSYYGFFCEYPSQGTILNISEV